MKEKQDLKKQLIILSIILVLVIILAIILNMNSRENESYTKIKDSTVNQNRSQETSVDDFMDKLKGLVEESKNDEQNTINYEETEIIELDTGEIVLFNEQEHED